MRVAKSRKRGLFRPLAFGLALMVYSSGLMVSAMQPPETPPKQSAGAAPAAVVLPSATVTGPASAVAPPAPVGLPPAMNTGPASDAAQRALSDAAACPACPAPPTWGGPVSQVPNFFGDFVARPASQAFVDLPFIVLPSSNVTVSTHTLTFAGLPSDVAGASVQISFTLLSVPTDSWGPEALTRFSPTSRGPASLSPAILPSSMKTPS